MAYFGNFLQSYLVLPFTSLKPGYHIVVSDGDVTASTET